MVNALQGNEMDKKTVMDTATESVYSYNYTVKGKNIIEYPSPLFLAYFKRNLATLQRTWSTDVHNKLVVPYKSSIFTHLSRWKRPHGSQFRRHHNDAGREIDKQFDHVNFFKGQRIYFEIL